MGRYQYSVYKRETGSAGGKAKNDAFDIMLEQGFLPSYKPSNNRKIRVAQQFFSLLRFNNSTDLVVQYPAISEQLMRRLVKKTSKLSSSTALIHDLPSIQGMGGIAEKEFSTLSHFDNLIVHNKNMGDYIRRNGYMGRIVELELFDYLHNLDRSVTECTNQGTISIAGNLDKSIFILNLGKIKGCSFNLYGINKTLDLTSIDNARYLGLLSSEEIVYKLEGDYGLVWDGESIQECSGIHGEYLKYNNPHKLSLYIAAGKPVITWKRAAIANFVERENIGITVDSLEELQHINLQENYIMRRNNVLRIKEKIANGYYLKRAIESIYGESR